MSSIVLKITGGISPDFERKLDKFTEQLAAEFYTMLTNNIRGNKFGFSNKPSTVKRKGFNKPGIDSGQLINQITLEGNKVYLKDGKHTTGISFKELASIVEFGRRDGNFIGYPFWRLTMKQFEPIAREKLEVFVKRNLFKKAKN